MTFTDEQLHGFQNNVVKLFNKNCLISLAQQTWLPEVEIKHNLFVIKINKTLI